MKRTKTPKAERPARTSISLPVHLHNRIKSVATRQGWTVQRASQAVVEAGLVTLGGK